MFVSSGTKFVKTVREKLMSSVKRNGCRHVFNLTTNFHLVCQNLIEVWNLVKLEFEKWILEGVSSPVYEKSTQNFIQNLSFIMNEIDFYILKYIFDGLKYRVFLSYNRIDPVTFAIALSLHNVDSIWIAWHFC